MPYAIIEFAGKQYKIEPQTSFRVTGHFAAVGQDLKITQVLAAKQDEVSFGKPNLAFPITLTVTNIKPSAKLKVATYRAKSRYRRVIGHRQDVTTFKVSTFGPGKTKKIATAKKNPPKKVSPRQPKKVS